jgi:hypothetical protein
MFQISVYPETPLWNELCAQDADPRTLLNGLQQRGSHLVISTQLICELAATFTSTRLADPIRHGRKLFSYLLEFIAAGVPCLKMNNQLLQDEVMVACGAISDFSALLSIPDYSRMVEAVEKLSNGIFEPVTQDFLNSRKALAEGTRLEIGEFVSSRPNLKARSAETSFEDFVRLSHPADRLRVLRGHLLAEFPTTPADTLTEVTVRLLQNPFLRVAHTMVRADMYATWRAARSGKLARDVQDDCYHLVNACYCDVYATKDRPQAEYAPSVVGPTAVRFYDGSSPVSDWLLAITSNPYLKNE